MESKILEKEQKKMEKFEGGLNGEQVTVGDGKLKEIFFIGSLSLIFCDVLTSQFFHPLFFSIEQESKRLRFEKP